MTNIFLGLLVLVILILGYLIYYLRQKTDPAKTLEEIENKLNKIYKDTLESVTKQLVLSSKQSLKIEKESIKTDLENKRRELKEMVDNTLKELREAQKERFNLKEVTEQLKLETQNLKTETTNLRKVLSNNQMRGQFGEQVAENLLRMVGFSKGVDYEVNTKLDTKKTRPDFSIFLPDGTKINVDVKFPYANLQKLSETDDAMLRKEYAKKFETDVKNKITQVTTRDYINPEEKTVDFVILFIPNEMIFSYIYDKLNHVWTDALKKHVILSGPFSFTAILMLVKQAYQNFNYQKNIRKIITHIKTFENEFGKYTEEFVKIGSIIERLSNQYEKVNTTRTRQLQRVMDKIKIEEGSTQTKLLT